MAINDKNFTIRKLIVYSSVVVLLFFVSLETIQRVRYFFRFQSKYWLFYGFADKPADYAEMLERGLIRRFGPQIIKTPAELYDKHKGYRKYEPNLKSLEYQINSFGFRGKEFDISKKEGVYRIVALGGSTTFGAYVRDGFTYPEFLERSLNSKSDIKYEVINGGINGCTIDEIENLLRHEIVKLNPDIIIINSVFNNFYYNKVYTDKYRASLLQKINMILLHKSLFYMTLREKMASISGILIGDIYRVPVEVTVNNFLKDKAFWRDMKATFRDVSGIAKDNNVRLIIIKEPIRLRDYKQAKWGMLLDKRFAPLYEKMYILLDEIAKEENVKIIDMISYFDSFPEKDKVFIDGLHLTEEGNEYMARVIAKELLY